MKIQRRHIPNLYNFVAYPIGHGEFLSPHAKLSTNYKLQEQNIINDKMTKHHANFLLHPSQSRNAERTLCSLSGEGLFKSTTEVPTTTLIDLNKGC